MKKKTRSTILIIVAVVTVIIIGGVIYLHIKAPSMLTQRIEKELNSSLNSEGAKLYDIEISEVEINSFFSEIIISYILVRPTEQLYKASETDTLPKRLFHLEIKDFSISSDGIIDFALKRDKINFDQLILPHVLFTVLENPAGREAPEDKDGESKIPQSAIIENLNIHLISFRQRLFSDTTTKLMEANQIEFSGAISHQENKEDTVPVILLKDFFLQTAAIGFFPQEEPYSYHCDSILFSTTDSIVNLFSIKVSPIYDKKEFQKHIKYQTDRMDVHLEQASLMGFDPNLVINENQLFLSQIAIKKGRMGVYRDRNLPLDSTLRPTMPAQLIRNAPIQLLLPDIDLQDIDLYYSELPENGNQEGVVPIENIKGKISNITNIENLLQKDSIMRISANATMFGQASLKAEFEYNLMDMNGGYRANGELTRLDFKRLNPVLIPLVSVKVEKGMHEKNTFFFSGNNIRTSGEIKMYYTGLSIVEPDRSDLRQNIVSWAGRNLLYYPSNPDKNNEFRTGTIDFDRDVTRFVFQYWWKSYLSGIKSTVVRDYVDL